MKHRKAYALFFLIVLTAAAGAIFYREYALHIARAGSALELQDLAGESWIEYDTELRVALAQNAAASGDILARLMRDRYVEVRAAAASNPAASAEVLRLVGEDGSPEVKMRVAAHPNTPCDVLRQLATVPDDRTQQVAARRAASCPPEAAPVAGPVDAPAGPGTKYEPVGVPEHGHAADCVGKDGLMSAAMGNCIDQLRAALATEHGARASLTRLVGRDARREALIAAIDRGSTGAARMLLDDGLDPNSRSQDDNTPLIRAAYFGQTEIVKVLLDHGAEINRRGAKIPDEERTALIRAVESDQAETVKLLLARGADPLLADRHGWTAIHYAAKDGHVKSLEVLVAHGVDVNLRISEGDHTGQTPLIAAAYYGHARTLAWLLEKGANPSLQDRYGYTALRLARERGHTEAAAALSR